MFETSSDTVGSFPRLLSCERCPLVETEDFTDYTNLF